MMSILEIFFRPLYYKYNIEIEEINLILKDDIPF